MVTVSSEKMQDLLDEIKTEKKLRADKMPDEESAINQLFEAFIRLKELGWSEACYCPKDESMFSAIEAGSIGVHKCNYQGEWPNGKWYIFDGDVMSARPILWRPRKKEDSKSKPDISSSQTCCRE